MSGVPINPPGVTRLGATSPTDVQKNQQKNTVQKITKNADKNTKEQEKNREKEENQKNKGKNILTQISASLEGSHPNQRTRKLPLKINTAPTMIQRSELGSQKRKLMETPVTPSILGRLSGALSETQNQLVSRFGKVKSSLECEHCTNTACISITSLKHDSDSDSDNEDESQQHHRTELDFECTICHRAQPHQHMNQSLGLTTKKLKMVAPSPAPSVSTPLPGTPASMVSPADIAISEQYMQLKTSIFCDKCKEQGSLVKFGFTKSMPPRPRFKCNQCATLFTIDHVVDMISALTQHPLAAQEDDEDIYIDAQPVPPTPTLDHFVTASLPILIDSPSPAPTTADADTITFLLNSVKQLTAQATANQAKFDYITTLIEQNKKVELDLQVQKKENNAQKNEIAQLKKLLTEKNTQNTEKQAQNI